MSKNNEVDDLVATGFILLIGIGVYKILKSFKGFKKGEEVSSEEIKSTNNRNNVLLNTEGSSDYCYGCNTEDPPRCYNGCCMVCNGDAGGGECNVCNTNDDDD